MPFYRVLRLSVVLFCALTLAVFLLRDWLPWPGSLKPFPWQRAAPAQVGLNPQRLDRLARGLEAQGTRALLVIRDDSVVLEWYARGYGPRSRHGSASLAKALTGSLALGCLLDDGSVSLDDRGGDLVPQWAGDPVRSRITLRQLAAHTSGLAHGKEQQLAPGESPDWRERFWDRRPDAFQAAILDAPVLFPPGQRRHYSGPGYAALSYALTRHLQRTRTHTIRALLHKCVLKPIGVPRSAWRMGYGRQFEMDGLLLNATWGGAMFTARATAAIGRLMLHHGSWEGRVVLSPGTVQQLLRPAPPQMEESAPGPVSAMGWWSNATGYWPRVPTDAVVGAGSGHEILLVIPSERLLVVRYGRPLDRTRWSEGVAFWEALDRHLLDPLMDCLEKAP